MLVSSTLLYHQWFIICFIITSWNRELAADLTFKRQRKEALNCSTRLICFDACSFPLLPVPPTYGNKHFLCFEQCTSENLTTLLGPYAFQDRLSWKSWQFPEQIISRSWNLHFWCCLFCYLSSSSCSLGN